MLNRPFFLVIALFSMTAMLSSCVSLKAHLEDRARVDQDIPGQAPAPVKTRKVIVLEVNENGSKADVSKKGAEDVPAVDKAGKGETPASDAAVSQDGRLTFPGQALTQGVAAGGPTAYTVEKDDTLQKIAKKFYGSYSKWTRIYDANKDVIKNPNFVKPGIILKVPAESIPVDKNYPPAQGPATDAQ